VKETVIGLIGLMGLVGCASWNDATDMPPRQTWTSQKTVDQIAACIIPIMNEQMKPVLPGDAATTHALMTTSPGHQYEIQPMQTVVEGADPYFVRLTALAEGGTKVEVFAVRSMSGFVTKIPACI